MENPAIVLLKNAGFTINLFTNADDFFREFSIKPCDFIIINVETSDRNTFVLCSEIRLQSTVPIIIISAADSEEDRVTAINLGCDDYVNRPFPPIELLARISSIFRRIDFESNKNAEYSYAFGTLTINLRRHEVKSGLDLIHLTNKEFDVLSYLIDNKDRIVSRNEMLKNIWGFSYDTVETRAIDDCIKRLRKKLSDSRSNVFVETVRGYGFRITLKD